MDVVDNELPLIKRYRRVCGERIIHHQTFKDVTAEQRQKQIFASSDMSP